MSGAFLLEQLAVDLIDLSRHRIGEEDLHAARACLLDAVSCAAVGVTSTTYDASEQGLSGLFGVIGNPVTRWFSGEQVGLLEAAYLNSVAVSAHDLDDGNRKAVGHPGGAVIPAVLALAESLGYEGDLLVPIIVGYEAGVRIAEARAIEHVPTVSTGRWAPFAVAAAAGIMTGQDAPALAKSMAHAGSLAPQLVQIDPLGTDGLKEGTPWGVVAGIIGHRLAVAGIPAPTYLMERQPDFGPNASIGAGRNAVIRDTYFKKYACCRWIHPALDIIFEILQSEKLDPETIESIDVLTFRRGLTLSNDPHPLTLESAHYSFPFCIALALCAGPEAFLPISASSLAREDVKRLADKVRLIENPPFNNDFPARTPGRVRIRTTSAQYDHEVSTAAGDPGLPFSEATMRAKHAHLMAARAHPPFEDFLEPTGFITVAALLPLLKSGLHAEVEEHEFI